ncbi:energy-coupling factor transporter transmembrane component T family protein [Methanolobus bombayensis]|uniref:energy-coupling factor transporter transmembrane component T family protein n=1 Tax=Methanolobus bombayensis TaxID=38023 RepID=UPI001AE759FB|nr:energy-coupling factor transporter transmembrane protein EcfT [Methanolobus bombayensis]MBP1907872.1 energy-coupling factor transport system permease protein [Methanolobus bombayensis]
MNDLFLSFIPGKSLLHRLDPRTKIIGLMVISICILNVSSLETMALVGLVFSTLVFICRLPVIHFIKSVRPMIPFFSLIFLMQFFFTEGTPILDLNLVSGTYEGLLLGGIVTLKFVFLILFAALITATTSPSGLTTGIEKLLRPLPLRYFGISSHDIAMMMSLSLYFVPMLYDNFKDLKDAQLSRGLDARKEPVKAIMSLVVPLVRMSLRSVDEVALAMESRCYTGQGRSSMHVLNFKNMDYGLFVLFILLVSCLVF